MPRIRQGDIHDYDFGPVIGAELSGRRPALIISTDEFNGSYGTAIALPMSTTMPAERYRTRQHVHIANTDPYQWIAIDCLARRATGWGKRPTSPRALSLQFR